jgi:glycoprotein-N-acetylgalactosamine 3-beta-galactosyltransferase
VTQPQSKFKAEMVRDTWGKKCDGLIFASSQNGKYIQPSYCIDILTFRILLDSSLPAIGFPIGEESRYQLWNKAKYTLRYVNKNHLNDFDWFFKADDDTYAIIENLREYIATKDPKLPWFLGRRFNELNVSSYLTGGPGKLS